MPRPQRCRRICRQPEYRDFSPAECSGADTVVLTVDEFEAIRLVDLERLTHEQCAERMDVSRTTVTEIYECARLKLADCIVNGKRLTIDGGNYRLCRGTAKCRRSEECHIFKDQTEKGLNIMRIAVTYENGNIFQHFGHTAQFKLYDAENGAVVSERVVDTMGSGHGALAGFLKQCGVDALICGGIGAGAQNALAEAGIKLYGGVSGSADDAAAALLGGSLDFNPDVKCSHHDHEHENGGHTCGAHGCGNHGCH